MNFHYGHDDGLHNVKICLIFTIPLPHNNVLNQILKQASDKFVLFFFKYI